MKCEGKSSDIFSAAEFLPQMFHGLPEFLPAFVFEPLEIAVVEDGRLDGLGAGSVFQHAAHGRHGAVVTVELPPECFDRARLPEIALVANFDARAEIAPEVEQADDHAVTF